MKRLYKTLAVHAAISACTVFFILIGLVAAEGYSGVQSVVKEMARPRPPAEHILTRFDADLGWTHVPGLHLPDLYGPGLDFKTNAQGFRSDHDFTKAVPAGKRRVVCSGDSFTLGYGVGMRQTWCARLEALDPRLETVNMGQGGYGLDQAYLWFMRDGRRLDSDLHLFAFIYADAERMQGRRFFGYAKPSLSIKDSRLVVTPPVRSIRRAHTPWLAQKMIALHRLKTTRFLETFLRKTVLGIDGPTRELALKIFETAAEVDRQDGRRFAVVYLPTEMDLEKTRLDDFRQFLKTELGRRGIAFIDLTDDFRRLGPAAQAKLFLSGENARFLGADGHYSEEGNRLVANLLYKEAIPWSS